MITLKEETPLKVVLESLESAPATVGYVEVDKEKRVGKFLRQPERIELPKEINESAIIEYYNRKL